ncbi:hypothetical protein ACHAW5_000624 [Stephanodiscus triporus]|uniref:Uncharacterized protein n=1 Tax=Stephanodiscus triporus TaxID=2934178 RepID=A0ABD3PSQ3_9STRA
MAARAVILWLLCTNPNLSAQSDIILKNLKKLWWVNPPCFSNILDLNPLMFIHMGDFHYKDKITLEINKQLEAYDLVMGSPSQRLLYMHAQFSFTCGTIMIGWEIIRISRTRVRQPW